MRQICQRHWWRLQRTALVAIAVAAVTTLTFWPSAAALDCEGVALDDGCLFTITGGDTADPDDGYAVTNADGVPLYDFVRERDLNAIGYPISQRWVNGPFTFQAFQKVILQWDPGKGRMNYYNTLDVLANRYPDIELPNVPPHQVLEADRGASFGAIIRNHLALLDQNDAIKARFLSEPDWLNLYGLPIRYEEREVNGNPQGLQMLRAQRTVFVIWNVPAPGTTVGRVNLQNVPDKVKKLNNVIIPELAKALRYESDPELPVIIATLRWVADGITSLEQAAIIHLQRAFAASESLLRTLIEDPSDWSIRNQPSQATVLEFKALADIAELPWARDGLSQTEHELLKAIMRSAAILPDLIGSLLQEPWVVDGVTGEEVDLIDELIDVARDAPSLIESLLQKPWVVDGVTDEEVDLIGDLTAIARNERQALNETQPGTTEPTIAYHLLRMPFLDSIEPFDAPAVESLHRIGAHDRHYLHRIVSHLLREGGITDHHAKIVTVLWYVVVDSPELLDAMLDASKVWVEERHIVLPHTGPTILAVIRTRLGEEFTMTYLEEAVRSVEEAMRRPFPTNYIALHVSEVVDPWGGLFLGSHIALREGYDDRHHYYHDHSRSTIHHEVAHYYWHSCPSWICEGAAVFLEMRTGVLGSGRMRPLQKKCEDTRILDITSGWHECHYFNGALMFHNLYWGLGEDLFLRGFWRLHDSGQGRLSVGNCDGLEIGLCHLRSAFITDAPADAASLADRFIGALYFGEGHTVTQGVP